MSFIHSQQQAHQVVGQLVRWSLRTSRAFLSPAPTNAKTAIDQTRSSNRRRVGLHEVHFIGQILYAEERLNVAAEVPRHAEIDDRVAGQSRWVRGVVSGISQRRDRNEVDVQIVVVRQADELHSQRNGQILRVGICSLQTA